MMRDDALLTFREALDLLRISRSTLYRLMWKGQLRGYKVGWTWRFYRGDLLHAVHVHEMTIREETHNDFLS